MEKHINFKIIKSLVLIIILSFIILSPFFCYAADNLIKAFGGSDSPLEKVAGSSGAGYNTASTVTVESMISLIITTALSFIGVIFLALAIYGGYIWMTARGNEEMVKKAQDTIINAIIGLVVVIAAYAISYYVIYALGNTALQPPK